MRLQKQGQIGISGTAELCGPDVAAARGDITGAMVAIGLTIAGAFFDPNWMQGMLDHASGGGAIRAVRRGARVGKTGAPPVD